MVIAAATILLAGSVGLGVALGAAPKPSVADEATRSDAPAGAAPITTPITVRGRVTDAQGRPVVGATIYLVSNGRTDALIGTTTTHGDGSYVFRDARLAVSRSGWADDAPLQGTFQVFGIAPGLGLGWHPRRDYQPRRRPDDRDMNEVAASNLPRVGYQVRDLAPRPPTPLFGGDPKVMDLRLPPSAAISGRILDDAGHALPGVAIRLGQCDLPDPPRNASDTDHREPLAIGGSAARPLTTTSGPDGSFRLEGLPREAGVRIHIEHPEYAGQVRYAATTDRAASALRHRASPAGGEQSPITTGNLEVRLRSTRRIHVRTVFADTGQPAPKVNLYAQTSPNESPVYGISDAEGELSFRLPPGDHAILADPTDGGAACIRTHTALHVADQPAEQSPEVRVNPACVLTIEVVEARTGRGVPGVAFLKGSGADGPDATLLPLEMFPVYIGDRQTDAKGRLRGVVEPGDWIFTVGRIYGLSGEPGPFPRERVSLPAHGSATLRFELRK